MWTCPNCERRFKTNNQSHMCVEQDFDRLFENKPDALVLIFDRILTEVMPWEPNSVGVSVHTIIFTNHKAWLILKPMSKEMDVKFYYDEPIESDVFKKIQDYNGKFAHHIRIRDEVELTERVFKFLKMGYDYALL